jgi:hypothetical protein
MLCQPCSTIVQHAVSNVDSGTSTQLLPLPKFTWFLNYRILCKTGCCPNSPSVFFASKKYGRKVPKNATKMHNCYC